MSAKVYTDDHPGYLDVPNRIAAKHSVGEYVSKQAHINGVEKRLRYRELVA